MTTATMPAGPVADTMPPLDRVRLTAKRILSGYPEHDIEAGARIAAELDVNQVEIAMAAHRFVRRNVLRCVDECGYAEDEWVQLLKALKNYASEYGREFEDGGWVRYPRKAKA
jgi:hypothetical protein